VYVTDHDAQPADPVAAFLARVNEVLADQNADLIGVAPPATVSVTGLGAVGTLTAEVVSVTTFSAHVTAVVIASGASPQDAVPRSLITAAALELAKAIGANAIYDTIDPQRVLASHAHEALATVLDTMPLVWSVILDLAELSAHYLQR
jgi:D-arabinose 1-dehydrogenase-like Zn-dependent alcohol dehydrogenase